MLNSNGKSSKIYLNQQLYLNIRKFLNDFDLYDGLFQSFKNSPKKASRVTNNKEQIQKICKSYLISIKNDPGLLFKII